MKYPYTVKYGGQYFAPGEDVPCEDAPETDGSTTAAEDKKPGRPKKE